MDAFLARFCSGAPLCIDCHKVSILRHILPAGETLLPLLQLPTLVSFVVAIAYVAAAVGAHS